MDTDFYKKLTDLYAGGELTEELTNEMEAAAITDRELAADMMSLRSTVQTLQSIEAPTMTEESFQRILVKMNQLGADVTPRSPEPPHWQYRLPMQG